MRSSQESRIEPRNEGGGERANKGQGVLRVEVEYGGIRERRLDIGTFGYTDTQTYIQPYKNVQ